LRRPASVNRKHQLGKDPLSGVARAASTTSLPTQPPTFTKDQGRLEIHDAGHTPDHPPRVWPPLLALASRTRDPDQAAHATSLDEYTDEVSDPQRLPREPGFLTARRGSDSCQGTARALTPRFGWAGRKTRRDGGRTRPSACSSLGRARHIVPLAATPAAS
jgi:hypothetical protein